MTLRFARQAGDCPRIEKGRQSTILASVCRGLRPAAIAIAAVAMSAFLFAAPSSAQQVETAPHAGQTGVQHLTDLGLDPPTVTPPRPCATEADDLRLAELQSAWEKAFNQAAPLYDAWNATYAAW